MIYTSYLTYTAYLTYMAIKKYFVTNQKDGYPYDRQQNKYFSWGFDIWLNRARVSERGFLTKEHAEAAVKALREDAKNRKHGLPGRKESPQLIELFQKKLDSLDPGPERSRAKRVFIAFLALLPEKIKVIDLKTPHLRLYKDKRTAEGVKNSTIKREMVPIIESLNNADQYFVELENYRPPKKPKLVIPKTRKTTTIDLPARVRILSYLLGPVKPKERIYQAAARRRVGLFLQFCLLTVSRPGEVAALKKTDVDLHAGIVKLEGTKTENKQYSTRELLITPTMRAILIERFEIAQGEYLFTKYGKVTGRMRTRLKEACEASGVKYGKYDPDGVIFYTARHTATSVLAHSNKVDTKTAGEFTGHSDETMTLYYTHPNLQTLQIAGEVLEENMGNILLSGELLEPKPKKQ